MARLGSLGATLISSEALTEELFSTWLNFGRIGLIVLQFGFIMDGLGFGVIIAGVLLGAIGTYLVPSGFLNHQALFAGSSSGFKNGF